MEKMYVNSDAEEFHTFNETGDQRTNCPFLKQLVNIKHASHIRSHQDSGDSMLLLKGMIEG